MVTQIGSITVFTGSMFSGKSKALMARLETKQRARKKVLIVKPLLDDRFKAIDSIVSKRKKTDKFEPDNSLPAHPIQDEAELRQLIAAKEPNVLGIDEAQFFGLWLGLALFQFRKADGLEIYVAGLDLDAWQKPFGPMPNVFAYADSVHKFTANCFKCGQDARFTQKVGGSSEQIQVGAEDIYEARCELCWTAPV
ncbi:MAG: thymidine kinase [Candidatus Yanofskybacteria bacterium]|nr:thymidine kinase [Candidatus Yanofskybacteria bacterium]